MYFFNFLVDIPAFLLDITGEVDTFVGLIYSTNDIRESVTAMSINREKFTVFMGTDEVIDSYYRKDDVIICLGCFSCSCQWIQLHHGY